MLSAAYRDVIQQPSNWQSSTSTVQSYLFAAAAPFDGLFYIQLTEGLMNVLLSVAEMAVRAYSVE